MVKEKKIDLKKTKDLFINLKWLLITMKGFSGFIVAIIFLGAISALLGIYRALVTKWLVDSATAADISRMNNYLILLGSILLFDIVVRAIHTILLEKGEIKISNSIQNNLYAIIIKTKWMQFLKYHSGDYLTRMTSDVGEITDVIISTIPSIITLSILVFGSFISIFYIDPKLAIVIITVIPLAALFIRFFSKRLKKLYIESQRVESKYRSFINESIQNMLVVKTFCLEKVNFSKAKTMQQEKVRLVAARTKLTVVSTSLVTISSWMGFFLVFLWGSVKIAEGTTTFGTLMALIQLIGNIQGPLITVASSIPMIVYALASVERLREIEGLEREFEAEFSLDMTSAGIKYNQVDFYYNKDNHVLKNIEVDIKPGETVALIGSSGEGKTTFIHLLMSLLNPVNGDIVILDGEKEYVVSKNSRGFISYVPQGNNIFSGSIADNLRLGKEDATEEELMMATKAASAWDFIQESENGMNTHIGERGVGLSEGQTQRIAIARALLHKAPILILDEATSALDSKTEVDVLRTIQSLEQSPTCIIITHRLSALKICDRILKIDKGYLYEISYSDAINFENG
ncbi:MAG: ABC transporter ATP-binding protein [Firmicutes bacterium HGW-Firmicutes-2]|jgi:ATP-binding cassette subfamily C protein|nr:MAG: ABC transporter ATP-binding protein [Firmicutes bacterium HGW-Firmicutes-2]